MKKVERALTPMGVKNAKPGLWCDGGGLYLQVAPKEAIQLGKPVEGDRYNRSWIFRYRLPNGKLRSMGLGPTSTLGLAEVREKARQLRQARLDGRDPIEERRATKAAAPPLFLTFTQASAKYIEAHKAEWRSEKHREQWAQSLTKYADPVIGKLSVAAIDEAAVLRVLEPIWETKTVTAQRIRGRISKVLGWAVARGHRPKGPNPAAWADNLEHSLGKPGKIAKVVNHAALPYADIGAFFEQLRKRETVVSRALQFIILTAARRNEVLLAAWSEVDLTKQIWTIPGPRMKGGREHRVPLSGAALEILQAQQKIRQSDYIFAGDIADKPLGKMSIANLLTRMGRGDITTHGFRATFKTWCDERTNFKTEVVEASLAHTVSDKVVAAYGRGDFFQFRRRLMDSWASYCGKPSAQNGKSNVTVLRPDAA
jgi:integrase